MKRFIFSIFIIIVFLFNGCLTPIKQEKPKPDSSYGKESDKELYENISLFISKGDTESAVYLFDKLRSRNPDNQEMDVQYAVLLISDGKLSRASEILTFVLNRNPDNISAMYNLAGIKSINGDVEEQLAILNRIIDLEPDNSMAYAALGELYLKKKRYRDAGENYLKSISFDPDNLTALTGYGKVLLHEGKLKESLNQFDKAVKIDPGYSFVFIDRSRVKIALGDFQGADNDLSRAIDINPGYYWNYIDRGKLRMTFDDLNALTDFNEAIKIDSECFYAYIFRADIYNNLDQREKAIADYKKIIEKKPDYYFAYKTLGILLYMKEDWNYARKVFKEAFKYEKTEYAFPLLIAVCYHREGKYLKGKQYLEDLFYLIPSDSLYYDIVRLYLNPEYDSYAVRSINDEKNIYLQTRMLFYLASFYNDTGKTILAHRFFIEVKDRNLESLFETRLAAWELDRYQFE